MSVESYFEDSRFLKEPGSVLLFDEGYEFCDAFGAFVSREKKQVLTKQFITNTPVEELKALTDRIGRAVDRLLGRVA